MPLSPSKAYWLTGWSPNLCTYSQKLIISTIHFSGVKNGNFRLGDGSPKCALRPYWRLGDGERAIKSPANGRHIRQVTPEHQKPRMGGGAGRDRTECLAPSLSNQSPRSQEREFCGRRLGLNFANSCARRLKMRIRKS